MTVVQAQWLTLAFVVAVTAGILGFDGCDHSAVRRRRVDLAGRRPAAATVAYAVHCGGVLGRPPGWTPMALGSLEAPHADPFGEMTRGTRRSDRLDPRRAPGIDSGRRERVTCKG